jgi:hypothetical protein
VFQVSKTCLLLGTLLLGLSFPAWPQNSDADGNPQVIVSVYNDADVSSEVLTQAEAEAAKIFARAGLEVIWSNCVSSRDRVSPDTPVPTRTGLANSASCVRFDWPSHLALRIVHRPSRPLNEVFGVAFLSADGTGCYTDVFFDQATELRANWNVDLASLLGNVAAHELGHLLLGSNSHALDGIMKARWQREELLKVRRDKLLFTADQAERMRGKLIAARLPRPPRLVMEARSSY